MELELVRHLARSALQNLEAHRRRIDDLNVYPVPDGDTGTNLVLTLRSIVEALDASTATDSEAVAKDVTRAALMGARGNSGVIFSQIVRGFVEVLGEHEGISSALLGRAFRGASDTAYRAVKRPVEGTMLTVIRAMAEESEKKVHRRVPPADLLRAVLVAGEDAVARTPELLDVLRNAGVVDAGGAGLVEIARGMVHGATGEELPEAPVETEALGFDAIHQELSEYRYCTVFVVEGESLDKDELEAELEKIGDSLLVVGDATALKVHVHTDDPGQALTLGTAVGVVEGVEIANMHHQTAQREERLLEGGAPSALATLETGLVAVCPGRGNRRLFESLGATRVIEGGQSMNPSAKDIVDAVEAVPTDEVLVLPNNSNVILTAEQAASMSEKTVRVIPSKSVQAGFAAMGRFVPTESPDENERAMLEELEGAATGEITVASRDASLDGVDIRKGAYLGLVDDVAVVSGSELEVVLDEVVDRVLAGGQGFLTILTGEDAPPLDGLVASLEHRHPGLEVEIHEGGQPHYPLLLVAQ
ncbi:MAG TPA: DAK2 domain-containing protein [Gaiellaceae bacterium]|nr:DAK2 domain-containing protein [Gaiellaceae bacterium]